MRVELAGEDFQEVFVTDAAVEDLLYKDALVRVFDLYRRGELESEN